MSLTASSPVFPPLVQSPDETDANLHRKARRNKRSNWRVWFIAFDTVFCMGFFLLLRRRPLSLSAKWQQGYRQELAKQVATRGWDIGDLKSESLYVRIIWFHRSSTRQDVDNIVKPILDSILGNGQDWRVACCISLRVNLSEQVEFSADFIKNPIYSEVVSSLALEHFVVIEIGESLNAGALRTGVPE